MNGYEVIRRAQKRGNFARVLSLSLLLLTVPIGIRAQQPAAAGGEIATGQTGTPTGPTAENHDLTTSQTGTPEASAPAAETLTSQQTTSTYVPFTPGREGGTQAPPLKEPAPEVIEQAIQQPPTSPVLPGGPDLRGKEDIIPGQTLNLNQCIEIALRQNTAIMAATGTVDVSRSRLGQARSDYYPQITAIGSYLRTMPYTSTTGTFAADRFDQYTGTVALTQDILNPRTWSSVSAAKKNLAASQGDLVSSENTVALNVKTTYYQVLQAKRDRDVAADVIKGFQLHLDQAQGFYDVGTKAKVDVIKAQVDLSNAKLALIKAENSYKIAWLNLNTAMGVPDAPQYTIEDNLSYQPYPLTLEEATQKAFDSRPDLKSAIARREAAESGVSVARSGYYPVLSGTASYSRSGIDLASPLDKRWTAGEDWMAGLTLTIPLFSGFLTSHQVAEAKGNLYVQKANEENQRQQVLLQVRQAYLALRAAEASIATAELAASQAKENLDLQNGRYAAGVGSPVEVSDAFNIYVQNQSQYTNALTVYKIAQAAIEQAMGVR